MNADELATVPPRWNRAPLVNKDYIFSSLPGTKMFIAVHDEEVRHYTGIHTSMLSHLLDRSRTYINRFLGDENMY